MPGWMKWVIALLVGFGIIVVGFRWAGWLLTTFFVLNCLVLIIVVLLQSGKAADLAGAFGGAGSQTAFGPRGAASVLSASDHVVRHHVHGVRVGNGGARRSRRSKRRGRRRGIDPAAIREASAKDDASAGE